MRAKNMDVTILTGIPGVDVTARAMETDTFKEETKQTGMILPGQTVTLSFATHFSDPVSWELEMWARGADNMLVWYTIAY